MINRKKITRIIRKYSRIIGVSDYKTVERVFNRGDSKQKLQDLLAMRAVIYVKMKTGNDPASENQQKALAEFVKKHEHTIDFKNGYDDRQNGKETRALPLPESTMPVLKKPPMGSYHNTQNNKDEVGS